VLPLSQRPATGISHSLYHRTTTGDCRHTGTARLSRGCCVQKIHDQPPDTQTHHCRYTRTSSTLIVFVTVMITTSIQSNLATKCCFPWDIWNDPHLIYGSLDPHESANPPPPKASQSIQSFLHSSPTCLTKTDRPHYTFDFCSNRPHLCMACSLIIMSIIIITVIIIIIIIMFFFTLLFVDSHNN